MVNVPVAAAAIVGGWLFVPTSRDPATPPVDVGGLILSSIGVTALVYTVIEAPNWGWGSAHTVIGLRGRRDRSRRVRACGSTVAPHPMLDVSVFANRRFSGGSLAVTAGFLTLFGFIFVITQYFQFIKSYSAFETGVRLLPVAISIALGSALGPRIVERIGTTAVVSAGLAIFAAGLAWASTVDAATPYVVIAMQMVLLGGGLGLTTAPATEAIMGSLSADKAGVGSAVNDTTRELGGTLGVAIVGQRLRFRVLQAGSRGRFGDRGAARRGSRHDGAVDGGGPKGHRQLPAGRAADVRDAVNTAFLDGLQVGALVCAGHRPGRRHRRSPCCCPPGPIRPRTQPPPRVNPRQWTRLTS